MTILYQVMLAIGSCTQRAMLMKVRRALRPAFTVLADEHGQLGDTIWHAREP
jgi:hypothetical protein